MIPVITVRHWPILSDTRGYPQILCDTTGYRMTPAINMKHWPILSDTRGYPQILYDTTGY